MSKTRGRRLRPREFLRLRLGWVVAALVASSLAGAACSSSASGPDATDAGAPEDGSAGDGPDTAFVDFDLYTPPYDASDAGRDAGPFGCAVNQMCPGIGVGVFDQCGACDQCLAIQCCDTTTACAGDDAGDCVGLLLCARACLPGDAGNPCLSGCYARFPGASPAAQALATCDDQGCRARCGAL